MRIKRIFKALSPKNLWRFLIRKRRIFLRLFAFSILLFLIVWYALPFAFPYTNEAITGSEPSTLIIDRNGNPLHHSAHEDNYRLQHIPLTDIPQDLIHATLAAEDKRFYSHGGVDILATCRAAKDSFSAGRTVSGASTITQQTVKLSSSPAERNMLTKIRESLTARHLEMTSDKETILTAYFHHLDYGNRILGPQQAALHYFGKPLSHLSLAECALLAGIPQSPTRHNPRSNPKGAKKRRDWVLERMQIVFDIDEERINRAIAEPIQLQKPTYLAERPQLARYLREYHPSKSSTFQTTIDAEMQRFSQRTLKAEISKLSDKNVKNGAIVIIHNPTREVLTLVGTADFNSPNAGQINAVLAPRSPGSALKPFAYLLAFDNLGMTPATVLPDIETSFPGSLGAEEFVNYDRSHRGPVTIHRALGNSLNTTAIRTLNHFGGPAPLVKLFKQLEFKNISEKPGHYGLSLVLGSGEVSLLEATNAFATLAQQGNHTPPRILSTSDSNPPTRVFSAQSSYLVTSIMADNSARAHAFGRTSNLRFPFPCAVKTGTSSDFRDNWCIGFTKEYTVGVWVGNLDNTPMKGISGVTGAGAVFHSVMTRLHRDHTPQWFEKPEKISRISVDPHTGKILSPDHPRYPQAISVYTPTTSTPLLASDEDYKDGKVYLDNRYDQWLAKHPNKPFLSNKFNEQIPNLRILSPSNRTTFLLDPDLPSKGNRLELKANTNNALIWKSETLEIEYPTGRSPVAILTEGEHEITIKDPHTQQKAKVTITVKSL